MKILVTRTDRLGDLVLSLPVPALLKAARPDWEVHLVVAPGAVPLVAGHPDVDRVWTWQDGLDVAARGALADALASEGFGAAVMLQYRRELALLLRRAGIRRRYGPLSKWSSWVLLNRGVRQNRSGGSGHESAYNLELAQRLLADHRVEAPPAPLPRIHLDADQQALAAGFRAARVPDNRRLVLLHPGSGGSALDWEPDRFAAVANALDAAGHCVAVTGAGADAAVIGAVQGDLGPGVEVLLDAYDLPRFLGVLAAADLFIGPSTGPLHMAAALGVPTLGLFPPVRTMHPDRWGPRGAAQPRRRNLVPDVDCPARRTCHGTRCAHYNCMSAVAATDVVAAAGELLGCPVPDRKDTEA